MIERLKQIIEYYNLSSSTFADTINVPKSSISHLLSGRNKPSLDFVIKVVDSFNEVDLNWLVYGKGEFPKSIKSSEEKALKNETAPPTLFTDVENTLIENNTPLTKNKSTKKIIILNEDGTFEEYIKE
ncbi:MAG: helix-turn-helix transcriptional regulator [Tenacibaculum sp.]|nr:helix-turn-helix transcriptional regulator [Tenacibaculum sp.]